MGLRLQMSRGHTTLVARENASREDLTEIIYDVFFSDSDGANSPMRLGVATVWPARREGRFEVLDQDCVFVIESVSLCQPVQDSRSRMEVRRTLLALKSAISKGVFPKRILS